MFTGAVRATGTASLTVSREVGVLAVETPPYFELEIGDAISVNGTRLTVRGVKSDHLAFYADLSEEILAKTTLGNLKAGDRVNLEQALRMGDAVGGHLLLGHVDGVGQISEYRCASGSLILGVEFPKELAKYLVEKGPVAVDGVGLPINGLRANRFFVDVAPLTAEETTLGLRKVGDTVNIETDILARYAESLLHTRRMDCGSFPVEGFSMRRKGHICASPHAHFCGG
jgi:riboflavin synthase